MQTSEKHVTQSQEWADFKNLYGTKTIKCGEIFFSKHKVPFTPHYVAYCPKVTPHEIDWNILSKTLEENGCIYINFDVPNIVKENQKAQEAVKTFEEHRCLKSPKNTFATSTIILDLTKSEADLLKNMHSKHRYNIGVAERKGVIVEETKDLIGFDVFFELLSSTAERQKYYIHPKRYYQKLWETLYPKGMCHILTAKYKGVPLSSWMLFSYRNTLYYPYGGSYEKMQNVFPSNLLGWEAIKLGKRLGCSVFDMWGASNDPENTTDPWWGFTNFKLKFGGELVHFIDSYDYVVNNSAYSLFNLANNLRWKMLKLIR